MKRTLLVVFILLVNLFLNACAVSPSAPTLEVPTATEPATEIPTAAPTATEQIEAPAVTIYYQDNSQFEIVTPDGRAILIDTIDPGKLSKKMTNQDILLVTHEHSDHYSASVVKDFPGQKLIIKEGSIELPDVTIRAIASAHRATDDFLPEGGTNYIFIIDVAGLRLVHFGDIGQDTLTPEQLKTLGHVDVAMMQLENSYSQMYKTNKKGFNLMNQLKPSIILQTHSSNQAAAEAIKEWKAFSMQKPVLKLTREKIPSQTTIIFMDSLLAKAYQKTFNLEWFDKP